MHFDNAKCLAFILENTPLILYLRAIFSLYNVFMYIFHLSKAVDYLDYQMNYTLFS